MTTLFTEAMNVSKCSLGSVWLQIKGSHWPAASSHWLRPLCGLCEVNTPFLIQSSHPWIPYHGCFGFFFAISKVLLRLISLPLFPVVKSFPGLYAWASCLFDSPLHWMQSALCGWLSVLDFCPRLSPGLQICIHLIPWAPSPGSLQYLQPHWSKWNLLPFFSSPLFLISHLFMSRQSFSDPPACY